ncbi:MAG: DoxX family protein [Crocinitomicaceae bacterium]|jgi:uncharacterized membrane protein|nr:DoxX family protein [Flavobacteriales bacterium]MDO7610735.1 DoxX family protein [Crocinitomicaceae bacterium]
MGLFKKITIYFMGSAYIYVGIRHFIDPNFFLAIMPDYLPYHLEAVYISGVFEILLGGMLLFKKSRRIAGWGLIALLIAVFPANIYLAQNEAAQQSLDISQSLAIIRLPFQALFLGLAYWHTKDESVLKS